MDNTQTLELQIKTTAEGAVKAVKLLNSSLKETKNTTDKVSDSIGKMGKALTTGGLYLGVKRMTNQFLKWMDLAVDRTEQLNLFNVVFKNMEKNGTKTFSTLGREATKFQNKLNEAFGTNLTETTKYQGLFQSMGENVGIPDTYSALMSTTMTKLTYDLASLYNKQESVVAEALRAGVYAGQTKPLRSYGIDVTQTSMQPILESLGITDRSIKQMSQAEKEILRYLATMKQAKVAMGDFANTIESPANQMKVFKQQLVEAKVALSSLFIGTFSQILPYANAFLMTVKEVAKALADILGIKLSDYNTGIASSEDAYAGLTDSIDNATDSVKELKRQTLGFDQINNISENKNSDSGNLTGGIDKRLLDAITGYDNGMENVRMKATEIRDKWMEILGFHKEIDPLTGEISYKLSEGYSNLKLIGAILIGTIGMKAVPKIKQLKDYFSSMEKTTKKNKKSLSDMNKVLIGSTGLIASYSLLKNAMYEARNQTDGLLESILKFSGGLAGSVGSGALIGSIFGPWGTVIGGVTGAFTGLIGVVDGYHQSLVNVAKSNIFGELTLTAGQLEEITSALGLSFEKETKIIDSYKASIDSLEESWRDSLITVEQYGLMYGTTQDKISKESIPTIISSIKTLGDNTKAIIGESTQYSLDLWTSMMSGSTSVTKEEQSNILKTIMENGNFMTSEVDKIQKNITSVYEKGIETRGYLTDEEYNYISEQLTKLRELTNISMSTAKTDLTMLQQDINSGRLNLSEEGYNQLINQIKEKEQLATDEAWAIRRKAYENAEQQKKIMELAGKSAEEIQQAYNKQIKIADENYSKAISQNQEQVLKLMETLEKTIEKKRNEYVGNAGEWGQTLYDKIMGSYSKIYSDEEKETIKQYDKMLEHLSDYQNNLSKKYEELGKDTVDGYVKGLNDNSKNLTDSTTRTFEMVPATTKKVLDSHSPSKRFEQIGSDTIQGYINGLLGEKEHLLKVVEVLFEELDTSFSSKGIFNGFETNITTSFNSILNKLQSFVDKFRTGINKLLSGMATAMNSVKTGADNKIYYNGMSYITVPKFANGGFPEDGMFFANHNELVGKFTNGKTAVANNAQIVEGIKAGVYQAVSMAMSQYGGQSSSIDVHVHTDEGTVVDRINQTTKQTGVCPINIPVY